MLENGSTFGQFGLSDEYYIPYLTAVGIGQLFFEFGGFRVEFYSLALGSQLLYHAKRSQSLLISKINTQYIQGVL